MPELYDLFTTNAGTAGYRLNYMEIYNWGTFNNRIYRIAPDGNNSLLTGANASGKSTLIDALLTLLVPAKKDRFYNQSSGNERKGDRTEETYVLGNYGNIQAEGESATKTQQLRDKRTYSVLLASFANNHNHVVTLFQVRWFVNGELKCSYGFSSKPLTIKTDFSGFNGSKGDWKKTLEKQYNTNVPKRQIEFYDTIKDYKDRIISGFGLRSDKALTLFNQIVGVKVLNDLDEFIRSNMLEQRDAESEYIRLSESFATLIEAKTTIEKVKEQIAQLKPIDEKAKNIEEIDKNLEELKNSREIAVYWFAQKNVELANAKITELNERLAGLKHELGKLNEKKEELKRQERNLSLSIENDNVGRQVKDLEREIRGLNSTKQTRLAKLKDYNKKVVEVGLTDNPSEQTFIENRETARAEKNKCQTALDEKNEELRLAKNYADKLKEDVDENIKTLQTLQKNKNNISGREAEIREWILQEVGATSSEIPFIGELIKVKENEKDRENSIEKILHNLGLRLIVPGKYYKAVSQFINTNNLKGRIVYHRFEDTSSLRGFQISPTNCLLQKIEFNEKSPYWKWVEDMIFDHYNYACVSGLEEFYNYKEKAVTKQGLIKSVHNKHEKDDRPHTNLRENYVLGWDNKEKIASIRTLLKELLDQQKQNKEDIRRIEAEAKAIDGRRLCLHDIFEKFTKYEEINWEETANTIQEQEEKKRELEATNDKVKALKSQLDGVRKTLDTLENKTIVAKNGEIFQIEKVELINAIQRRTDNQSIIETLGAIDVRLFEESNQTWIDVSYKTIESKRNAFQSFINGQENKKKSDKAKVTSEVADLIRKFKNPSEEITQRFKDWRSDVHTLPESSSINLIGEYQKFYERLVNEDLVRHEKKFDDYLQETVINKVSDFRMFFNNWEKSIRDTIQMLNQSLSGIDFSMAPSTYIQLVNSKRINTDIADFRRVLENAIPNIHEINSTIDGKRSHFEKKIQPLMEQLKNEQWRRKVMDVRSWYSYKAEEFYKESGQKFKTYESMGQLSGGEKAQLTYTILGSAIAYQFGLTKDGLQAKSLRFIAIDEAFKAQDEDKARYLISLCKQLNLQLLVVTPSDNIHIVENDISFVHYVERNGNESRLFDMPIEIFKQEREKYQANDFAN
ncbi:ATP-binding protein [Prevotella sp. OH937_COT-195]|uniref:ATP-binding protein n=1 Tax=Prevotella sp. OH937_COT-195 TaxID=2491051 RepID=UPI000F653E6F|nr:SbcC/MukB-like Walker B domain-containing protein [Prevotella sp. OH937_COT-195]RRC98438.1 AAA family ATPase [Prevotella sp. OH937_COT-195]